MLKSVKKQQKIIQIFSLCFSANHYKKDTPERFFSLNNKLNKLLRDKSNNNNIYNIYNKYKYLYGF